MISFRVKPIKQDNGFYCASILVLEDLQLLYAYRTHIDRLTPEDAHADGLIEIEEMRSQSRGLVI